MTEVIVKIKGKYYTVKKTVARDWCDLCCFHPNRGGFPLTDGGDVESCGACRKLLGLLNGGDYKHMYWKEVT